MAGPSIVVSHSLGTIISYDVLREEALRGREVPLFVTVGSPLAVQEVQDLVVRPLLVPSGVAAWRNVADARDLVALDSTIRPEYDPERLCADFLVVNDSNNHHGIREYLSTAPIRDAVCRSVGRVDDPTGSLGYRGTAWMIGDGLVATNYHVLQDIAPGGARIGDRFDGRRRAGPSRAGTGAGRRPAVPATAAGRPR